MFIIIRKYFENCKKRTERQESFEKPAFLVQFSSLTRNKEFVADQATKFSCVFETSWNFKKIEFAPSKCRKSENS